MYDPTHTAARNRLDAFVPHAGYAYATQRNFDRVGHAAVSNLSPYLRHRIIAEDDVLRAVLAQHSPKAAEKFIQEVYWRTYWKGWLEMRPAVWQWYKSDLKAARNRVQTESGLRADWEATCAGQTGIDCFDHWAQELVATGYLHNHARMWFASIWIFTLRLPWVLGADFFMRHLLDGDPASNTLSWRWVGGLQTQGKTYLARPDNIAKYTEGRFTPKGLATVAIPLEGPAAPAPQMPDAGAPIDPAAATGVLLTEEDMSPGALLAQVKPRASTTLICTGDRSPLHVAPQVIDFVAQALDDATQRYSDSLGPTTPQADVISWAQEHKITQIVTAYTPVGPTADRLAHLKPSLASAGITLVSQMRPYDAAAWPFATKGFFKFKDVIPKLLPSLP